MFDSIKRVFGIESSSRDWSVGVSENGRDGHVTYRDAAGTLSFYWEFCGGDVIASVSVGKEAEWRVKHPWAAVRRAEILQRVADEVIRQKAPNSRAEIDDQNGFINIR